jgi:serine protease Do
MVTNMTTLFEELTATTQAVAARVGPSIVAIGRNARGTGIVLAPGQVLTNAHNLRDRTTQVTFPDGRAVQATVAGIDPDNDLAVLTVDTGGAPALEWHDGDVTVGAVVFAAAPNGRSTRVTFGLVTTVGRAFRGPRGRRIEGSIEHSALVARGSSGGPLVTPDGRLVGVNTHRLGDGFTLAIPADAELRRRVDELARGESPVRRRIGVAVASPEVTRRLRRAVGLPDRSGLLVRGVEDGSPAARAGIQEGDLLVKAGGADLTNADTLFTVLDAATDELELVVLRGADERTVTVRFSEAATESAGSGAEPGDAAS